MTEHNTQFQDNAVCPFCGFKDGDSFEYNESDTMGICPACGKSFELTVEYSVTYSTIKPDWLRLWREYNNKRVQMSELGRLEL